jgi:hypothetical protein
MAMPESGKSARPPGSMTVPLFSDLRFLLTFRASRIAVDSPRL